MATTTSTITSKSIVSIPPTPSSYDKTVVETAIASIIATQSVRNEKTIDAIEKTESFPPAEILALVDYNRIYDISAAGEIKKNSYGSYYETLESVHSITNEDVAYIVQKCLENDVAGQWAALKNIADSDVIDSNNLINFLSNYFLSIQRAEESLNFLRKNDENIQAFGESYLNSRISSYHTKPENRVFTVDNILGESVESNASALKKILKVLKNNLTREDEVNYLNVINSLSLKAIRDLNLVKDHWEAIDNISDSNFDRLVACCEVVSHVLSLSVGTQKFNNSNLLSKVSNKNDLGSIFDGTNLTARPGRTSAPDPFPYRRNTLNQYSDMTALALLQYDDSDGNIVVPIESENSPDGYSYLAGRDALVRQPILEGEFTFAEFKKFIDIFEKNRSNIELYLEMFLGQCDPVYKTTPIEICKIICRNFLDGLTYADSNELAKLTLFLLKISADDVWRRQFIVRAVEIIKSNQVDVGISSTDTIETTTRTSEGEVIDGKAEVKTTRVEIKKTEKTKRIIEKYASNSSVEYVAATLTDYITDEVPSLKSSRLSILTDLFSALASDFSSSTFFNFILKTYNDIVEYSASLLPDNQELVNRAGTTLYANFDEFGILVLIVECFVNLSQNIVGLQPSYDGILDYIIKDESVAGPYSLEEIKDSLRDFLNQLEISELSTISVEGGYIKSVRSSFLKLINKQEEYQNSLAYLAAFSDEMRRSRINLEQSSEDLLNNSPSGLALNTQTGREVLANLSQQQISSKRSILERYRPESTAGYLPSRTIYSALESKILDTLLSSTLFSSQTSENFRIITCAAPILSINNKVERDEGVTSTLGNKNQTGMLELVVFRKDHELDDIIFKSKNYIFDPLLYAGPNSFEDINLDDVISGGDILLEICKNSIFALHDLEESKYLRYSEVLDHERYRYLTQDEVKQVMKNTMLSYLMETYIYKLSGGIFDESLGSQLNTSVSDAGLSAISTVANLKLPNLVLPSSDQINSMLDQDREIDPLIPVQGLTIGDKEIIAALANSYLVRNDRLIDRFTNKNNFDRVLSIVVDPDDFEVDIDKTISDNGLAGRIMVNKLQEQGLLVENTVGEITQNTIVPRDPTTGGFSIGNLSCQFSPHSSSTLKDETTTTDTEVSGADPGGYVALDPKGGLIKYGSDAGDLSGTLGGAFEKESADGGSSSGGPSTPSSTTSTTTPA